MRPAGLWLFGASTVWDDSAWIARLSEGSVHQAFCQRLFFLSLVLMGLATMLTAAAGPACGYIGRDFGLVAAGGDLRFPPRSRSAWTLSEF